jgi:hypothetical protein
VFLFILLFPLRYPDILFRIFILIVGVSLLTEAMLLRQKGLVFFLLFYGLCGAGYPLSIVFSGKSVHRISVKK